MGGRIAEQVRRALILAAKMAPVLAVVDAGGCGCHACGGTCDECGLGPATGGYWSTGGFVSKDAGPLIFTAGGGGVGGAAGMSGRDAGSRDARADAPSTDARDAGKDGD